MLFDDLFYPDNVKRRQEVANLRGEITITFRNYKSAWNDTAKILNTAFSNAKEICYSEIRIPLLQKNIEVDTIGDCIQEIQTTAEKTKDVLDKFVKDIGIDKFLPGDWERNGCIVEQLSKDEIKRIGDILSSILGGGASLFVGYYIFRGVATISAILAGITRTAVSIGALVGGAFAGAILGGVAFVVTDLIASAITGAIERKELNEAIDSLSELKSKIYPCLNDATLKLGSIAFSIENNVYRLDSNHILLKDENGNYVIVSCGDLELNTNLNNTKVDFLKEKEKILFIVA